MQETVRDPGSILGSEDPLEEGLATHSSALWPGESHGQKRLEGYSPLGCIESDTPGAPWHTHPLKSG